ncbi:MAG: hypothetical protein N2067_07860 [Spirochaetaceae bacterium]|nr:hypothetical protein [Spirochaetaceae bacterium]
MKRISSYLTVLLPLFLATLCVPLHAQTADFTLQGANPPTIIYANDGSTATIDGSITIIKNTPSTTGDITVDLLPPVSGFYRTQWNRVLENGSTQTVWLISCTITIGNLFNYDWKYWKGPGDTYITDRPTQYNLYTAKYSDVVNPVTVSYRISLRGFGLAPGTYYLPCTFRLRTEKFRSDRNAKTSPVATLGITASFVVSPSASISFLSDLSGTTPITSLDFIDVAATTTKYFRVSVKSNFRYGILVRSRSGGVMVHEDASVSDTIPYRLMFAGSYVDLSKGTVQVKSMQNPTGISSVEYQASVTVDDITTLTAGNYSDALTFSVIAQ